MTRGRLAIALALCSCSFLKQQHSEEHATASLSEEARAIEEAQATSSETYTEEPTIVTVDTATEVFQPVIFNPLLLEVPCPCPDGGVCTCLQHAPPPAIATRTTTHRVEEHGAVRDQRTSESSGQAAQSLSLDAGVATEGHADKESDTKPAPSCAFAGSLWAIAAIGIVLLAAAAYRRATRQ